MFFKSGIWFVSLAVLSAILTGYSLWRKKDLKLVALQLFLSGIAGLVEDIIFIWLQSYHYFPGLLKTPYCDNALGAYFSQVLYVSAVALFIAAFGLGYGWVFLFAGMFVGIEYLFLYLGIYKLNWWNPVYTLFGLLFYFWLSKKWYALLLQASSRWVRLISLICMNYILYGNMIVIPALANHYHYAAGWFADPARNTLVFVVVYCYIRGAITALVCFYRLPGPVLISVPVFFVAGLFVLIFRNLLTYTYFGDLLILPVSDITVLYCCYHFNRILAR